MQHNGHKSLIKVLLLELHTLDLLRNFAIYMIGKYIYNKGYVQIQRWMNVHLKLRALGKGKVWGIHITAHCVVT